MAEEFPIIPERTAMLFFDTQNSGWHPKDPEMDDAVQGSGIIGRLQRMSAACREAGIPVFYSQADHRPDYMDWLPHIVGNPPHETAKMVDLVSGSWNVTIIEELKPQVEDYVVKKHRWSAFYQTHLELSLRTRGIDTIILAGGATNVGVASTAYSARDRDFSLIVLSDGCRTRDPSVNEYFMDEIFPRFARVMTVDEAISKIGVSSTV
jgi:nicotinamidase-related amidase